MKTNEELFEILDNIDDISISDDDPLERIKRIKHYIELALDEEEYDEGYKEEPEPVDNKTIIISEDDITNKMQDFLYEIDADELARLAGEFFGGECYFMGGVYHFYPDENYFGAFDKPTLSPIKLIKKLS